MQENVPAAMADAYAQITDRPDLVNPHTNVEYFFFKASGGVDA